MTDPAAPSGQPSPAAALEARFRQIFEQRMRGTPVVNPALRVQAIGFMPWDRHWLGILVTPWFMNLMLLPREAAHWPATADAEARPHVFPAGVFEFIAHRDAVLGDYQACSLFSPMFDFADAASARATALAVLQLLFDPAPRAAHEGSRAPPAAAAAPAPGVSKRELLFGGGLRAAHGPGR